MSPVVPAGGSPVPNPLPDRAVETIAARFRVIADPTRIRLMEALDKRQASVDQLAEQLRLPAAALGLQLDVLHQAGIVRMHDLPEGSQFALVDWTDWWFVQQMAKALEPTE